MYAELAFLQLFVREEEIEFPQPVKDVELGRKQKHLLQELEVCVCVLKLVIMQEQLSVTFI